MEQQNHKDLFRELIHDDVAEFAKLVPKVKQLVRVKPDGTPVIVCDSNNLSQQEQIIVYLTGRFFAKILEFSSTDSAKVKEISLALRLPGNIVSARLVNLKDAMLVDQISKGEYKISTASLEKMLDQIIKKIGG